MASDLTGETVELLQTLIRNRCVNEGTAESGFETRNADVLQTYVEGAGVDIERWEPAYGRLAEAQVKWEAAHGRPLQSQ